MTNISIRTGLLAGHHEYVSLVPFRFGVADQEYAAGVAVWYDGTVDNDPAPLVGLHKDLTSERQQGFVQAQFFAPIEWITVEDLKDGDIIAGIKTDEYGYSITSPNRNGFFAVIDRVTGRGTNWADTQAYDLLPSTMNRDGARLSSVGGSGLSAYKYLYTGRDMKLARIVSATVEPDVTPYEPTPQHVADLALLSQVLMEEANRRRWCNEYDEIVQRLNERLVVKMEERASDLRIYFSITGTSTITVSDNGISVEVQVEWRASYSHLVEGVARDSDPDDYAADIDVTDYSDEWEFDTYYTSFTPSVDVYDWSDLRTAIEEQADMPDVEVTEYEWE